MGGTDTSEAKGYELRGISAIVFQNPEDQIVASTVEEEVAFGPENLGCPPEEILARLEPHFKEVYLDLAGRSPSL